MVNLVLLVECTQNIAQYKHLYINTINNFIQAVNAINPAISLTIAFYNIKSTLYCLNQDVKDIKPVTENDFVPKHRSCYYDSAIQLGHKLEKIYKINNQQMPLVFILCNSGDENSNAKDRLSALQIAIEKSRGWGFIFSGASDNAIELAQKLNYQFIYRYCNTEESLREFVNVSQKTLTDALLAKHMEKLELKESG